MPSLRVLFALALLLAAIPAAAQTSTDGTIRGVVHDEQGGALPGVALSATSPTVPGTYTAISDAAGVYRILNLPPGEYTVTAVLQGFSRFVRDGVYVRAGLNLTVDMVMKLGTLSETVEVKAETPMLETSNTVQALNISGEFQRQVPISSRRGWADVMSVAPGVVSAEGGLAGTAGYFFVRGAGNAQQKVAIDGADMGSSQQATTNQTNISVEALADTQVKTGAIDASSPLGFGGNINMVTKSGTNALRGTLSLTYQSMNWNGNNVPGGTSPQEAATTPDFSVGGPIWKDHLWFFGSYRHQDRTLAISRTATEVATLTAIYPSFTVFNNSDQGHFWLAKGTVKLGAKHQINAYYQSDTNPTNSALSTDAEQFGSAVGGGPGVSGSVSSVWNSAWVTRFSASYSAKSFARTYRPDKPGRQVFKSTILSAGRLVGNTQLATLDNGNNGITLDQPNYKYTLTGEATYYRNVRGGAHEVKAGFYFQPKIHAQQDLLYANGGLAREALVLKDPNNPAGGTIPFWQTIYDSTSAQSSNADTSDYAFYVQDNWRPTSRLTVNAGLRVDLIRRVDNLFDVQTQKSTEVGPRFGLNYMVTKDLRNAVSASWVRIHEMPMIGNVSVGTTAIGYRDLYDINRDGIFETQFVTPATTVRSASTIIDPNRHQAYVDEWIVGYRRQFPGLLTVGATYTHRNFESLLASVEVNGIYENGVFKGYKDETQNAINLTTNSTNSRKVYSAFDLQLTKQVEQLQIVASYGRQWRHMDGTWEPNDPASFIQPDAFANDKGIGGTTSMETSSLTGSAQVAGLAWRDHVFRLAASYRAPWGILLATNYIVQSGIWSGPVVSRIAAPDPAFGPPTVTLSNGRVVSNPLATVIRFAEPTRSEGQFTTPVMHWWNIRVGKEFVVGRHRIEAAVDLLNVVNAGGDYYLQSGGNQTYSANYKTFTYRQPPRSVQLYLRYAF
jgi:hypothetical protein